MVQNSIIEKMGKLLVTFLFMGSHGFCMQSKKIIAPFAYSIGRIVPSRFDSCEENFIHACNDINLEQEMPDWLHSPKAEPEEHDIENLITCCAETILQPIFEPIRLSILEGHDNVSSFAVNPNRYVATGSYDGTARIWDNKGECIRILKGHKEVVDSVAWVDKHRVVTGSRDNKMKVWDILTGECLDVLKGSKHGEYLVRSLVIRSETGIDQHCVITKLTKWSDITVRLWNLDTKKRKNLGRDSIYGRTNCLSDYYGVRFSNQNVKILSKDRGHCFSMLKGHKDPVWCKGGIRKNYMMTWSHDKTATVWFIPLPRDLNLQQLILLVSLEYARQHDQKINLSSDWAAVYKSLDIYTEFPGLFFGCYKNVIECIIPEVL